VLESNTEVTIQFEISNICTALVYLVFVYNNLNCEASQTSLLLTDYARLLLFLSMQYCWKPRNLFLASLLSLCSVATQGLGCYTVGIHIL